MRTVKIICRCRQLVDVVDRMIVNHKLDDGAPCSMGGQRYIPQRSGGSQQPSIEVTSVRAARCSDCGIAGVEIGLRIGIPTPPTPSGKTWVN